MKDNFNVGSSIYWDPKLELLLIFEGILDGYDDTVLFYAYYPIHPEEMLYDAGFFTLLRNVFDININPEKTIAIRPYVYDMPLSDTLVYIGEVE